VQDVPQLGRTTAFNRDFPDNLGPMTAVGLPCDVNAEREIRKHSSCSEGGGIVVNPSTSSSSRYGSSPASEVTFGRLAKIPDDLLR